MEWTEVVEELIDIVQQTAPELWRIANLQVKGNIIRGCLWTVVSFIIMFLSTMIIRHGYKMKEKSKYSMYETTLAAGFILLTVTLVAIPFILDTVIAYSINPEYYAIKVLIDFVK